MNLYEVVIQSDTGFVDGESVHVSAENATKALEKAFRKHEKLYPKGGQKRVVKLLLVERSWA